MKKRVVLPIVFLFSVGLFLLIQPKYSKQELAKKELARQVKKGDVVSKKVGPKENYRKIASIPPKNPSVKRASIKTPEDRTVIGNINNQDNLIVVNKVSKNWKEKYQQSFLRMVNSHEVKNFEVKLKKSILKVKENTAQNLEHVVVSYTNAHGDPFSFEALIDSATGQSVQTWNKTRYEHKHPPKLKARGREFYGN